MTCVHSVNGVSFHVLFIMIFLIVEYRSSASVHVFLLTCSAGLFIFLMTVPLWYFSVIDNGSWAFRGRETIWISISLPTHVSCTISQRRPGFTHVKLIHREVGTTKGEQNNTTNKSHSFYTNQQWSGIWSGLVLF